MGIEESCGSDGCPVQNRVQELRRDLGIAEKELDTAAEQRDAATRQRDLIERERNVAQHKLISIMSDTRDGQRNAERHLQFVIADRDTVVSQRDDAIRQRDMAENRLQGVGLLERKLEGAKGVQEVITTQRDATIKERNAAREERDIARGAAKLTSDDYVRAQSERDRAIEQRDVAMVRENDALDRLKAEENAHEQTKKSCEYWAKQFTEECRYSSKIRNRVVDLEALEGIMTCTVDTKQPAYKMCKGCIPCPRGRPCDALEDAYSVIETLGREVLDSHGKTNDWISAWQKANRLWTNSEEELTAERKRTAERITRLKEELRGAQSNSERWETNSDYHRGRAGDQDGKLKEAAKKIEQLEGEAGRTQIHRMTATVVVSSDGKAEFLDRRLEHTYEH